MECPKCAKEMSIEKQLMNWEKIIFVWICPKCKGLTLLRDEDYKELEETRLYVSEMMEKAKKQSIGLIKFVKEMKK